MRDSLELARTVTGVDLVSESRFLLEERSDVYMVPCAKGGKKLGIKARGKEDSRMISAGDKGA